MSSEKRCGQARVLSGQPEKTSEPKQTGCHQSLHLEGSFEEI